MKSFRDAALAGKSVIGLNLCPFAEVLIGQSRALFVSEQRSARVAGRFALEPVLTRRSAGVRDRVIIHPWVLNDFIEYNDFLEAAMARSSAGLEGRLQVASFHPQYQFADSQPDDIENYTNRSPYPILHLLREASVERAIAATGDTTQIYLKNMRTLRALGHAGWQRLWRE